MFIISVPTCYQEHLLNFLMCQLYQRTDKAGFLMMLFHVNRYLRMGDYEIFVHVNLILRIYINPRTNYLKYNSDHRSRTMK